MPESFTTLQGAEKAIVKGVNRFLGGGGLQFVHSGAAPQEAVTPLIDYSRTLHVAPVDIKVAMPTRVIKNLCRIQFFLRFIWTGNVFQMKSIIHLICRVKT